MNKQTITLLMTLILGSLLLIGCSPTEQTTASGSETNEKTIFVGAEKVPCEGVAPQECYLIKENASDDWQLFYDEIAGFTWEPGFEYELRIEESRNDNPPADASAITWTLVEVVAKTAVSPTPAALTSTTWILQSYHQPLLPDTMITIEFSSDGQVSGSAGCNSYFGSYALDGGSLLTGPVGSTEMWCDGLMDQESAFLQALQTATSLTADENSLTIHTPDGDMQFAPAQDASLEGTDWVLSGIAQGDAVSSTPIDTDITIQFSDGQVSGSAGCNSYGGSYQIDGRTLTLSELMSTLMACAEDDRNQRESEFMTALNTVTQFRTDMNQLILSNDAGQDVLFFTARGS